MFGVALIVALNVVTGLCPATTQPIILTRDAFRKTPRPSLSRSLRIFRQAFQEYPAILFFQNAVIE